MAYVAAAETALKFLPLIMAAPTVIDGFVNTTANCRRTYEETTANAPAAKYEALKKYREDSKREHEATLNKMEEMNENLKKSAKEQEEEADRRLREQKKENEEDLEVLRKKMKENEEKHLENMRKMNEEHSSKMRTIQEETKEAREKTEKEHREKMKELEEEHRREKKEAQDKLEKTKMEADAKIKEAEAEKEKVIKERKEAQELFSQQMKRLAEEHHKTVLRIQQETSQLRIENANERRLQLEETSKLSLEQLKQRTTALVNQLTLETNRELIRKFQSLVGPMEEINNSVKNIQTECLCGDLPVSVEPGRLDPDFAVLRIQKAVFNSRLKNFGQNVINATMVHPEIFRTCQGFITEMSSCVEDQELSSLICHLPRAIDADDTDRVKQFGQIAARKNTEFQELCGRIEKGMSDLTSSHLHENRAVQNGNQSGIEN